MLINLLVESTGGFSALLNKKRALKNYFVSGILVLLAAISSVSQATVTFTVGDPTVIGGSDSGLDFDSFRHTYDGEVLYTLSYSSTTTGLTLTDDPDFFSVEDEFGTPVSARILVESVGPPLFPANSRRIVLDDIAGEGTFNLVIAAGSAFDDDGVAGQAGADVGIAFDVDKTESVGQLLGPFVDQEGTIPVAGPISLNGTVYYQLSFEDDALDPLTAVDIYNTTTVEEVLPDTDPDFPTWILETTDPDAERYLILVPDDNADDDDYTGDVESFRVGDLITVRLSNLQGPDGLMGLDVESFATFDYSSNISDDLFGGQFTLDNPAGPPITLSGPSTALAVGLEIVEYTVEYKFANAITLSAADITLVTTGDAGADITVVSSGLTERVVELSNVTGNGTIAIELASGTASDAAGDLSSAAGPSISFTVETEGPSVIFESLEPISTDFGPVTFGLFFEEAILVGLVPGDLIVNASLGVTYGSYSFEAVDLNDDDIDDVDRLNVVFTDLEGDGTLSFVVPAGAAVDEFGRLSLQSEESPVLGVGLIPAGDALITISEPSEDATISGPISYTITYSGMSDITLSEDDITLDKTGTADATGFTLSNLALEYTLEITGISGVGTLGFTLADGTALDGEGEPVSGRTSETFDVGFDEDTDGDLVPNNVEVSQSTNPDDPADYLDTDFDLVPDFVEKDEDVNTNHLDGRDYQDTDEGLTPDYVESVLFENTDLIAVTVAADNEQDDQQDTDGDGLPDYLELKLARSLLVEGDYDPVDASLPIASGELDSDSDGILNGFEFYLSKLLIIDNSLPSDDFDRDGYVDYLEIASGLDPSRARLVKDDDDDGIEDKLEVAAAPVDLNASKDSDEDLIPDFIEWLVDRTQVTVVGSAATYISGLIVGNPPITSVRDTDFDGIADLDEIKDGFNPLLRDQPVPWINIVQGGSNNSVSAVGTSDGLVTLELVLGNYQTNVTSVTWIAPELFALDGSTVSKPSFNPAVLSAGKYSVSVQVVRSQNDINRTSTYTQLVNVREGSLLTDNDEDGIWDFLDGQQNSIAERNTVPTEKGNMSADYSTLLRLGDLPSANGESSVTISYNLLLAHGPKIVPVGISMLDDDFGNTTLRNNFTVNNLSEAGDSIEVMLPYEGDDPVPELAVYRLLLQTGWQTFNTTSDEISSSGASCDTDPGFTSGLLVDALCIKLKIQDGGANDLDGLTNGSVKHLGAVALAGFVSVEDPLSEACLEDPESVECLEEVEVDPEEECVADPSLPICEVLDECIADPTLDGCEEIVDVCLADPDLEECQEPTADECAVDPTLEECADVVDECIADPDLEGCAEVIEAICEADPTRAECFDEPKIKVGSAGSLQSNALFVLGGFLLMGVFVRNRKLKGSLLAAMVLLCSAQAQAKPFGADFLKYNPFKKVDWENYYLGAAVGQSGLQPEFSNFYTSEGDTDTGFKLWLNYHLNERLSIEGEYAILGAAGFEQAPNNPTVASGEINYQNTTITGFYQRPVPFYPVQHLSVFAKAGASYADISSDDDLNIEVADRFSPSFGAGLQYALQKGFIARLEYETFNKDADLFSLGISKRLGEPKKPEPYVDVVAAEIEAEIEAEEAAEEVEEEVLEVAAVVEEAPAPEEPELVEEIPPPNLEELFAELKSTLEPTAIFQKGSAEMSERLMESLDELVYFLLEYEDVTVIVTGHASDEGHEYLNENLSRMRSHGTKSVLQANGIEGARIKTRGRGEDFPLVENINEENRIRNRRVEFDFYVPRK